MQQSSALCNFITVISITLLPAMCFEGECILSNAGRLKSYLFFFVNMHLFCLLIFVYAVVPGTLSGLLSSYLNLVMSGHLVVVLF